MTRPIFSALFLALAFNAAAQDMPTFSDNPMTRTNKHMHNYTQQENQPVESHENVQVPFIPVKSLNATQKAFDHSKPTDNTVKFEYSEFITYKIRLREFMSSLVVFPKDEAIVSYKIGDDVNFNIHVDDNNPRYMTIDPMMAGADTSMHVVGSSGNVYTFYLRSDTFDSGEHPHLKVFIRDDNLARKKDLEAQRLAFAASKSQEETEEDAESSEKPAPLEPSDFLEKADPSQFTFGYEIVGSDADDSWFGSENTTIRPVYVFDDGVFTYFSFSEESDTSSVSDLPAVYRVTDGNDIPTNATMYKNVLRVEGVHNNWTLRSGESYYCLGRIHPIEAKPLNMATKLEDADDE